MHSATAAQNGQRKAVQNNNHALRQGSRRIVTWIREFRNRCRCSCLPGAKRIADSVVCGTTSWGGVVVTNQHESKQPMRTLTHAWTLSHTCKHKLTHTHTHTHTLSLCLSRPLDLSRPLSTSLDLSRPLSTSLDLSLDLDLSTSLDLSLDLSSSPSLPPRPQLGARREFEADRFARDLGHAEALKEALVKLNNDNSSFPLEDALHSMLHDSHPRLAQRLDALAKSE